MNTNSEILSALADYDTATISNIIGTFPDQDTCLALYNPWTVNWYTDERIRCMFPEHGARAGHVVTVVYGLPDSFGSKLGFVDILKAIEKTPKPVILAVKQDFPEEIRRKNGLLGGNMLTAYQQMGVTGILTDGPSRDLAEIRPLGVQCLFTGVAPAHGKFQIQAVNVPVNICGMDVCPGEIVHMDENGAVKFPAEKAAEILENVGILKEREEKKQTAMKASTSPEELAALMKSK